jgi:hypothetical protein
MTAWKLCEPVGDWRTDAPESLPFCVICGAPIGVDDQYAIGAPLLIACCPCAGFTPRTRPSRALRPIGLLDRGFARSTE